MQYTFASQFSNPLGTRRTHTNDSANVSKERLQQARIVCRFNTGKPSPRYHAQRIVFITFEGIDGSGKSTQARLLQSRLRQDGHLVLLVREPGGVQLAERVRDILLSDEAPISPFAELLLFSAARAQLVREKIKPALDSGTIVLCDRFFDSTTAYQGVGRGVADPEWLEQFHLEVTGGLVPDLTFLIDVPLEVAAERRSGRDENGADRMESSGDLFFDRVRQAYLRLADENPNRFHVLDGTQSPEALHTNVVSLIDRLTSRA